MALRSVPTGPTSDLATASHEPVLLQETLEYLAPRSGGRYGDVTLGLGGHAAAVLEACGPDGTLIGMDRDGDALSVAKERLLPFGDRVRFVQTPMSGVREALAGIDALPVDGLLADLGVSSMQLDRPERGFSFRREGPLDMRMDQSRGETARELILRLREDELAAIVRDLGEERHARLIARNVHKDVHAGLIHTTAELAALVARSVPSRERRRDPATRTFQALRLAVNRELDEVDRLLDLAPECLRSGGRLVVIAFHSLEDRIVKNRMRDWAQKGVVRLLTKRIVVPTDEEIQRNPRSRSARLRAVEKI